MRLRSGLVNRQSIRRPGATLELADQANGRTEPALAKVSEPREEFVRFVSRFRDRVTGQLLGVIHASNSVVNDPQTPAAILDQNKVERAWFSANLKRPHRFARSRNSHPDPKALSWFRPAALEHIAHAEALAELLIQRGIEITKISTSRPGIILHRDAFQIAAIPFRR